MSQKRWWLKVANIIAVIWVAAIGLLYLIGNFLNYDGKIAEIGAMMALAFQFACLTTWAWTLYLLYRAVKNVEQLLPAKNVFVLHGSLLLLYVVSYALMIYVISLANHSPAGDRQNYLTGISNFMLAIVDLFELLTFYLVVFLMLPLSDL